ncbi:MAG: hypothetical protein ACYDBV_12155 [Nitrospiria bacterium]
MDEKITLDEYLGDDAEDYYTISIEARRDGENLLDVLFDSSHVDGFAIQLLISAIVQLTEEQIEIHKEEHGDENCESLKEANNLLQDVRKYFKAIIKEK